MTTGHDTPTTLAMLGARRDELLRAIVDGLHADARVAGAWLSGSFGRDEADAWSDLDLHVAVADDGALSAWLADPHPLFALGGAPLLVQANFPSDSMPNGRFWLVVYDGPVGVDWNIGPHSSAVRPVASRLLFARSPIPLAVEPPAPPTTVTRDRARIDLEFFWAMAPIALKYAGRGHTGLAVRQAALMRDAYERLWRAVTAPGRLDEPYHQNRRLEPSLDGAMPRFDAVIDAAAAIDVASRMCGAVATLHPALAALGVDVPDAMPAQVAALREIARAEAARGGSAPDRGSRR